MRCHRQHLFSFVLWVAFCKSYAESTAYSLPIMKVPSTVFTNLKNLCILTEKVGHNLHKKKPDRMNVRLKYAWWGWSFFIPYNRKKWRNKALSTHLSTISTKKKIHQRQQKFSILCFASIWTLFLSCCETHEIYRLINKYF